jgi:hypothetical protein
VSDEVDGGKSKRVDEGDRVAAMASMVAGTVPPEDATPVLSNKMTSRSLAMASLRAGSWSSRVPMKCWKNTSGGRPGLPKRR